jgi:hypothetical protein
VAEDARAKAKHVVDEAVAIDILDMGARCARDEQRQRAGGGAEVAVDAAGNDAAGSFQQRP